MPLDFFTKRMIFVNSAFHILSDCKNWPKLCRLAIIPFQNISKNPLEHITFRQKSVGFCILEGETPQPVLLKCTPQTDISHC